MYKIGEISRCCGLTVKTLRYYDEIGLLVPDEIDRFTGYRYYSAGKLAQCARIVALKALGFSLDEISLLMARDSDLPELLIHRRDELAASIAESQAKLARLDELIAGNASGQPDMIDLSIKRFEERRVLITRGAYETRDDAWHELEQLEAHLPPKARGNRIVINYETEYKENGFDLAVGVEVLQPCAVPDGAELKLLAFDTEVASAFVPADRLDAAYREVYRQIDRLSLQAVGAYYECYHPDGTGAVVELCVPICRLHEAGEVVSDSKPDGFEDDREVIGLWEFADLIPSEEQFYPGRPKYGDRENIWLKRLCFMEGGQGYWIIKGWSKGELYTAYGYPHHAYTSRYHLEKRGNDRYLFLRMKDYSLDRRGGLPLVYVYRQTDRLAHTPDDLRIRDRLPDGFTPDEQVSGDWTACDCVKAIGEFDPQKSALPKSELYWSAVRFDADGTLCKTLGGNAYPIRYTSGLLIDDRREITEAYQLRPVGGRVYLFCEWKSGDYVYGGRVHGYYVFER